MRACGRGSNAAWSKDSRDALFVFIHPPTPRTTPFSATHLSRVFSAATRPSWDTGFLFAHESTSCASAPSA